MPQQISLKLFYYRPIIKNFIDIWPLIYPETGARALRSLPPEPLKFVAHIRWAGVKTKIKNIFIPCKLTVKAT